MNIGLFGLLGIVFIALKLTSVIDWSWVWVTSPFWGGFTIWFVSLVVLIAVKITRAKGGIR